MAHAWREVGLLRYPPDTQMHMLRMHALAHYCACYLNFTLYVFFL